MTKARRGWETKLFWDTIRMSPRGERVEAGMNWLDSVNFQDAQAIYFCLPCLS